MLNFYVFKLFKNLNIFFEKVSTFSSDVSYREMASSTCDSWQQVRLKVAAA